MIALWLLSRALACETPLPPETFLALLASAGRDPEAATAAREAVPCLDVALAPVDAALYHRAMAEDAWKRGAAAEAIAEMRAARALAPTWVAPARLHDLWTVSAPDPLAPSLEWSGLVDGSPGRLYLDRAALLQQFAHGTWSTRYVLPLSGAETDPPAAPVLPTGLDAPLALSGVPAAKRGLLYTGIGLAAVGLVSFGMAVEWNAEFKDLHNPDVTDATQLADLGNRTNAATIAAWVGSAGGAVCIGAALIHVDVK